MNLTLDFSPHLDRLFAEGGAPLDDQIRRAHAAGLRSVEFGLWRRHDVAAVERAVAETGVSVTCFDADPPGNLVDPGTHRDFLPGVRESARLAARLGCADLVVHAGDTLPGVQRWHQEAAVVTALRDAADIAARSGVAMLLEPLSRFVEHPESFVHRTPNGFDIVRRVERPNVHLLYNAYHSLVMGEEPGDVLAGNVDLVGHIRVAGVPGRREPGTGAVGWRHHVRRIRELGYDGAIGLDYNPSSESAASIAAARAALSDAGRA